jgi:hypothetical protein
MSDRNIVKLLELFGRITFKANSCSIRHRCPLIVDWLTHTKRTAIMPIKKTLMAGSRSICKGLTSTQNTQDRVIKGFGAINIVGSNHNVAKHNELSLKSNKHKVYLTKHYPTLKQPWSSRCDANAGVLVPHSNNRSRVQCLPASFRSINYRPHSNRG